jgi:hypothetical protein
MVGAVTLNPLTANDKIAHNRMFDPINPLSSLMIANSQPSASSS